MWNKIKLWFKAAFKPSFKLDIYMKSGNVIRLTHVTEYEISNSGDRITRVHIVQKQKEQFLLVTTIDLSQIEAVVRHFN